MSMKKQISLKKLERFYETTYIKHEKCVGETPELLRRLLTVKDFLNSKKGINKILDAGCSRGYLSKVIKNKEIYGIDVSSELLKDVKGYKEVKKASLFSIPYRDNFFDLVICFQVLEHVPNYRRALRELKRVAKKYILLSTDFVTKSDKVNSRDPFSNPHGHIHQFNLTNFVLELKKIDLEILDTEYHYPLLRFSTLEKKKGMIYKMFRMFLLEFNVILDLFLKRIYFNKVKKIFFYGENINKLNRFESLFKLYGRFIDLEVEIALLLKQNKINK